MSIRQSQTLKIYQRHTYINIVYHCSVGTHPEFKKYRKILTIVECSENGNDAALCNYV